MQRTQFAEMACSIARAWAVVGEPWTPLIIRSVFLGIDRFDQLQEDLGVARNILAERLERLVEAGVLVKAPVGRRFKYELAEAGRAIVPVLVALMAWGDRYTASRDAPPLRIRHRACGKLAYPQILCECGEPLSADSIIAVPGPGGRAGAGTMLVGQALAAKARAGEPAAPRSRRRT